MPGLAFTHFFGAAMVVADIWHCVYHHLSVQLQGDAKGAMYAGVIGTHVEKHEFRMFRLPLHAPVFGSKLQGFLFQDLLLIIQGIGFHLRGPGRMLLAQRVPLPVGWHQDAIEIGMAFKIDAKHIPGFPLVPVGAGP